MRFQESSSRTKGHRYLACQLEKAETAVVLGPKSKFPKRLRDSERDHDIEGDLEEGCIVLEDVERCNSCKESVD